jgi:hypothetical protein
MTAARPQSILAAWDEMGEDGQRSLFPRPDQRAAADTFARTSDNHLTPTGDFMLRVSNNMALILSAAAAQAALKHNAMTAQALVDAFTLETASLKHRAAVQTLLQLIYYKEAPATKFNVQVND